MKQTQQYYRNQARYIAKQFYATIRGKIGFKDLTERIRTCLKQKSTYLQTEELIDQAPKINKTVRLLFSRDIQEIEDYRPEDDYYAEIDF